MPFSFEEGIQRILDDPIFSDEQRIELLEYAAWLKVNRHIKSITRYNYLGRLRKYAVFKRSKNRLSNMTKKDVYNFLDSRTSDLKNSTIALKSFLRYANKRDVYDSFKTLRTKQKIPDILTPDEVKRLIKACRDDYERAFVEVTWESAGRIGEIMALRMQDLTFFNWGLKATLRGKTGERVLPLVICAGTVQRFINNHPNQNVMSGPLFYSPWHTNRSMTKPGARQKFQGVVKRADIKKHVYPHLLRHTRGTELARPPYNFTERQLMMWMGHNDHNMVQIYIHLSGRDVEDKYLSVVRGKQAPTVVVEPELKEIVCPRCSQSNINTNKFCAICGLCLDVDELGVVQERELALSEFAELLKDGAVRQKFVKFLSSLKQEET